MENNWKYDYNQILLMDMYRIQDIVSVCILIYTTNDEKWMNASYFVINFSI